MTMNSSEKKLTQKDLMGIFWRSFRQDAVWNFERQQNLGSAYTMSRVVGKLYEDDKEKRARALQRHVDFRLNQRIIAGNAQFTGIAAGRGVSFTTGLLLLREGLGMRETPIRPHS